mgnify:CR=1 FL=1
MKKKNKSNKPVLADPKVGDKILTWDEGSMFIFDDTEIHEVWHKGDTTRISFIIDFRRDPDAPAAYPEFIERRRQENRILDMLKGKLKSASSSIGHIGFGLVLTGIFFK